MICCSVQTVIDVFLPFNPVLGGFQFCSNLCIQKGQFFFLSLKSFIMHKFCYLYVCWSSAFVGVMHVLSYVCIDLILETWLATGFTWSFKRCISLRQRLNGWQDIKIHVLACSLPHKHKTLTNTTRLVSHFYARAVTAFVVSWISKAAAAWFTQSKIIHPYFKYIVPCNFKPPAAVAWLKKKKKEERDHKQLNTLQTLNNDIKWTFFKHLFFIPCKTHSFIFLLLCTCTHR